MAGLGAALRAIGRALAAAGSYVAEVGRELGLAIGDVAAAVGAAWGGLDVYIRRRVALFAAVLVALAALWVFAVPALPCQYPGGDVCPPPDDAASLVPADALAYVHVDTDASSDQYRQATAILARLPVLSSQIGGRLLAQVPAVGRSAPSFTEDVRPWLGDEAALALLPAAGAPQEVELLGVGNQALAERYQRQLAGPGSETIPYRGVHLVRGRRGVASAIVAGFLVIGTTAGTEAAIDVATGAQGATPLSDSPAAAIRDELPAQRVADAYLSSAGAAAVAGRPTGLLAPLAPFFAPRSTNGVAIGLTAASDGLELRIRSALDPKRASEKPGFFAAFPTFDPTLAAKLPAKTLAYFGIGDPGHAISSLLAQASTQEPGLARALTGAVKSAQQASGVNLTSDLETALGKEGALALEPAPPGGAPYALYLGTDIDPKAARATLVRLEAPLAHALGSSQAGGSGGFRTRDVGGVQVQTLDVSPAVELSYAIVGKELIVATNPIGVAAAARGGLAESSNYTASTDGLSSPTSLIGLPGPSGAGDARRAGRPGERSCVHHLLGRLPSAQGSRARGHRHDARSRHRWPASGGFGFATVAPPDQRRK